MDIRAHNDLNLHNWECGEFWAAVHRNQNSSMYDVRRYSIVSYAYRHSDDVLFGFDIR